MASKTNYREHATCLETGGKSKIETNKEILEAIRIATKAKDRFPGVVIGLVGKGNEARHNREHGAICKKYLWVDNNHTAAQSMKQYAANKDHITVEENDFGDVIHREISNGTVIGYLDDDNIGFLNNNRLNYINTSMEHGVSCITMVMALRWGGKFKNNKHSILEQLLNNDEERAIGYFRDAQYQLIEDLSSNNGYTIIYRNSYSGGQTVASDGEPMMSVTVMRNDLVKVAPALNEFMYYEAVDTNSKHRAGRSYRYLQDDELIALLKIIIYFESCWTGLKYIIDPAFLHQIYRNSSAYNDRKPSLMTLKRQLGIIKDRKKWVNCRNGIPFLKHLSAPIDCMIGGKPMDIRFVFEGY